MKPTLEKLLDAVLRGNKNLYRKGQIHTSGSKDPLEQWFPVWTEPTTHILKENKKRNVQSVVVHPYRPSTPKAGHKETDLKAGLIYAVRPL